MKNKAEPESSDSTTRSVLLSLFALVLSCGTTAVIDAGAGGDNSLFRNPQRVLSE